MIKPDYARDDLARRTIAILFIFALLAVCVWIVRPFLPATVWAMTLVIATWPIMRRLQAALGNRRGWAVAIMTIALLLVFAVPFWLAIATIVRHSDQIVTWTESATTMQVPAPPAWVPEIPLVGERLQERWQRIADTDMPELLQKVRPYAGQLTAWFLGAVGSFGSVMLQFLLTVAISALLYLKGESAAAYVKRFGLRLAGDRGMHAVILAGQAIRGVALGVVVTAFVQTALGAFALIVTGVPYASILIAVMLMLCVAQLGPILILAPAVIWMYSTGSPVTATVLLVLSLIATLSDNILRPILIRKGVDLPLLLILVGVVGGLVAFGLIGLFLGPTLLAVGYTLFDAWVREAPEVAPTAPPAS